MSDKLDFPLIEVAVALIARGDQVLAVYNPKWGSFTLPMTKRRQWHDPNPQLSEDHRERAEDWVDAAARAAAEWLGRTCSPEFLFDDTGLWLQGDRDGTWKRYHFQYFLVEVEGESQLAPGSVAEWLRPEEFDSRRPISPTAKYVIKTLKESRNL